MIHRLLMPLLCFVTLASCGGGSSGGDSPYTGGDTDKRLKFGTSAWGGESTWG